VNKSLTLSTIVRSAALALIASATAHAQVVDIDGGNSWAGWNSVGNSQTSGTWVQGSTTRTYDIYSTYFVLNAGQTVGGTRIAGYSAPYTPYAAGDGVGYTGDLANSLFSGVWQAGDRIVGMGIQYSGTTRGSTFFFHRDAGGSNIAAASSFGANDGVSTFDVGDSVSYMTTLAGNPRGQVRHYQIWNGFSQNGTPPEGNFTAPYSWNANPAFGPTPFPDFPTRTFAVLDNGSMDLTKSVQYFVNIDAILRSNGGATFGDGDFGPNTRFGFWEGHAGEFSQQIFAIPAPGAIALLGLAGLAGARRRR
jgi:hypothetical protein